MRNGPDGTKQMCQRSSIHRDVSGTVIVRLPAVHLPNQQKLRLMNESERQAILDGDSVAGALRLTVPIFGLDTSETEADPESVSETEADPESD